MRRLCPLCCVREAAVVSPDCYLCHGHGFLELGPAAGVYDPVVVSTAIALAAEAQARDLDRTTTRSQDPGPVLDRLLDLMARNGLIRRPKAPAPAPETAAGSTRIPPARLAQQATGAAPNITDQHMIRAACFTYTFRDRPGARGLPLLSRNWHPSSLARIGDPMPFELTTEEQCMERQRTTYHARAIAHHLEVTPS